MIRWYSKLLEYLLLAKKENHIRETQNNWISWLGVGKQKKPSERPKKKHDDVRRNEKRCQDMARRSAFYNASRRRSRRSGRRGSRRSGRDEGTPGRPKKREVEVAMINNNNNNNLGEKKGEWISPHYEGRDSKFAIFRQRLQFGCEFSPKI